MSDISAEHILRGTLSRNNPELKCTISPNVLLECCISKSPVTVPAYDGEYDFIPDQNEHLIQTKGRLMQKNMIFREIPYEEVSNNSGGTTVTIGGY